MKTQRANDATEMNINEKLKADALQEDLEIESGKYKNLQEQYRKEREKSARDKQTQEEIEKSFHAQIDEILKMRQEQYEQEENAMRQNLKDYYDLKLKEKMDQLDTAHRKVGELDSKIEIEKKRFFTIKEAADAAVQLRKSLESKVKYLEEQLKTERSRYTEQVDAKERFIKNFRERSRQTDEDFNALMDVKIALALEIKAYRLILEDEENRVGNAFPTPQQNPREDLKASLVITSMEVDGKYFQIRNTTIETISLRGWTLRSRETMKTMPFPDIINLKCGASIQVFTGPDAKERAAKGDIAWDLDGIWDPTGDSAQLVNPQDQIVHDVAVVCN